MSYMYINPCGYCEKKDTCKDSDKIQKAISDIHTANDGTHQGSGAIMISCNKSISINK